tara:strand:+ start:374 stop:685 length:312 start_codon:yes stop_codon:yes gene_type:complete
MKEALEEVRVIARDKSIADICWTLAEFTGFLDPEHPKANPIPHMPQWGKNHVTLSEPGFSQGQATFVVDIVYRGNGIYDLKKLKEFPNKKSLSDYNPDDYQHH